VCNDRIFVLKLKAEPVRILLVQMYMPISDYEDEEVEKFCLVCLIVQRVLHKLNVQSLFIFATFHILR
jgi:predicted transcriptional regulator